MKIDVLETHGDNVKFSCSIGEGVGICKERNLIAGMNCDVELDVLAPLEVGLNTEISNDNGLFLHFNGKVNIISANVESIDEDGSVCLRLAKDCILIIDHVSGKVSLEDVLLIKVCSEELEITLTGI